MHHAFFQGYGVKNDPKNLLQKLTPNCMKIIKNNKMHSPGLYRPPREPQSTPTQNCEMNILNREPMDGFSKCSLWAQFSSDFQN